MDGAGADAGAVHQLLRHACLGVLRKRFTKKFDRAP
jgi:hypothetical protein